MTGVIDVGTGITRPLSDYTEAVRLENVEHREGDEHERKDNCADITTNHQLMENPKLMH